MKYIAFTFDDGRSDNYLLAKRIMDKYQFCGTVYITTGFIDNTWEDKDVLQSPTRPLTVEEINRLHSSGWEIGLHGDKHKTQINDMRTALDKLQSWGITNCDWGISVPNSSASEAEINALLESEYGNKIVYIRRGRRCNTAKFKNKVLYVLYSVLKSKSAYHRFNAENVFSYNKENRSNIPSVVVKSNDRADLVIDFIKTVPDNSVVVLMLHSILSSDHAMCGKDPWSWDEKNFEILCSALKDMENNNNLKVKTLMEIIKESFTDGKSRK